MSTLKIAGATLNQIPFHWQNNVANVLEAIEEARKSNADLLCLPELCLTGYGCEDTFLSDWLTATAWSKLPQVVAATKDIIVCVGIPVRIDRTTYNGVCVIRNKKILGVTLKQNMAKDGGHYAPRRFDPCTAGRIAKSSVDKRKVNDVDFC